MIREIAIEPELIIEWSKKEHRREFKPHRLRVEYGVGSPKRMSRYPKHWRRIIGELLQDIQDPLRKKRIEELAIAVIENSIKRFECIWDVAKSWYENALEEHERLKFEVLLCRANFQAKENAISIQDFMNENEEKLERLNLSHGSTPKRNSNELVEILGPWLFHAKKVLIIDPYFDPNRREYSKPLVQLIQDVLSNCSPDNFPFFEIIRKYNDNAPTLEHLKTGFEQYVIPKIPDDFEIYFSVLDEKQGGEKLHQRYILSEVGGVRIDPGFDTQDDPNGSETYDINLLDIDQYLTRWEQYYLSDQVFELKHDQLIITNNGITA